MRAALGIGLMIVTASATAAVPLADFAKHPQYTDVQISPDGKTISAISTASGPRQLVLVSVADMKSNIVGARDNDEIGETWWASDDRLIYNEGIHIGGLDRPVSTGELFSVKANGGGGEILFGMRAGATMSTASHIQRRENDFATGIFVSALPDDPNHALIASLAWNGPQHTQDPLGAFPQAFKIDLRDGAKTPLATAPLRGATIMADHNGAVRLAFGFDNDGTHKVFYRDASGGEWKLLHDSAKEHGEFFPMMFDRTNAAFYYRCAGNSGVGGICKRDIAKQSSETLWSAKEAAGVSLLPTADGNDAFAIRSMPGRPALTLIDKSAPEVGVLIDAMKQYPGEDVQIVSEARDGKRMILFVSADTDPGVYFLYDAEKKKLAPLFQVRAWIKPAQMAAMEPVQFKARDGLAINGYLTRPPGSENAKALPTVVLVHGGPYGIRDRWGFHPDVQMLASRGYAVLQVNYRGSGGYGNAFERAGYREWGGTMQDDVTDATHWAIEQGFVDKNRVCIYGASYGGYAAMEGVTKEPDLYKCAIADAGVYDLRLMMTSGDIPQFLRGQTYLKTVLGSDEDDLWNRSPLAHVDRLKAKVMLVVGGADTRVPAAQGERLHDELDRRHITHEWLYERSEGHGFYDVAHTTELYEKIVAFLDAQIGAK
ncbi:MAG TPA: S9 family peptidase [Rudaea sp.]|jgi:dipeptidyl aminopeptidase/acylaminoacyl peptidase|nr:S9 family peptidase [Rudaea sp.]